ncbi:MAG: YvcK family protein [Thermoleophilia bacterium]|nr:YvcK family protein [Thermoleophilia bacterium]
MVIALLAGGTGGAKLAVGLRDALASRGKGDARADTNGGGTDGGGGLRVIANTGDDIEVYGTHVSPDPDLITFRLAGVLGDRGFGIAGESHDEMDRRRAAGEDVWFELGDDDLAVCRARAMAMAAGATQTEAHRIATAAYPTGDATVLPMCDQPVRTVIATPGAPRPLQEYLIRDRCEPAIEGVSFDGIESARPTPLVERAIAEADAIVIGPSNPVISIQPILALPGMRDLLCDADAPVLAVSPYVGGEVLKGPTAKFMAAAGMATGTRGVADYYWDMVDAWIADEPAGDRPTLIADVRMDDRAGQLRLARELLRHAESLTRSVARP